MSWKIELSPGAVESLRRLSRAEQRRVAERIRHLESAGLPPGAGDGEGPALVPAGAQRLACHADDERRLITVVTIHTTEAAAPTAIRRLLFRKITAWIGGGGGMGGWVKDLGYAVRALRKAPGFTAVAVLTLALGIGAASAIFSVAEGVLFSPLPYGEPDRVVTIWASWDNFPDKTWVSVPEFQLWHQENRTLEDAALYFRGNANFTEVENPERVGAAFTTPNLFEVLRVEPVIGRAYTWEEARLESPPVVVAHETWQRRWGGDPGIVGRRVEINGVPTTVLGVLPEGFRLPVDYGLASTSQVFYPNYVDLESPAPDLGSGGSHGAYVVGRLRDGVTVAEARSDLERVQAQVEPVGLYSAQRQFRPRLFAARDDVVGSARGTIWLLLATVGFVLLIACGNVANLLLSRAESRVEEMAVRSALGASRARIVRQLLVESGLLAGAGALLGLLVAGVGVGVLLEIDPAAVPRSANVSLNGTVVLFTAAVASVTALLFGAAPALRVVRDGSGRGLGRTRGAGAGARSNRSQGILVALQMAMAVILLTGSGLMARTFVNLLEVDPGFRAENVLTLRLTTPAATYPEEADVVGFYEELLRRVRALPGVREAGAARLLPLASTMGDAGVRVEGYQPGPNEPTQGEWQWATPGYFEVMGIPLLEGRTFDSRDGIDGAEVIVVNEALARRYFGERSPLGATIGVFGEEATVIGVVGTVAHNGITAPRKERFYRPHAQITGAVGTQRSMTVVIGTEGAPSAVLDRVRGEIRALDPSLPVAQVQTMDEVLSRAISEHRFALVLLGAFAAIALTLAVVGIYGVLSYAVSRRTQEIGVRLALGAEAGTVVGLVVRQGMTMALVGVATGTVVALGLSRFMESLLYGVPPRDPATFVLVATAFAAVALAASLVPALRAARVDPARALRYE